MRFNDCFTHRQAPKYLKDRLTICGAYHMGISPNELQVALFDFDWPFDEFYPGKYVFDLQLYSDQIRCIAEVHETMQKLRSDLRKDVFALDRAITDGKYDKVSVPAVLSDYLTVGASLQKVEVLLRPESLIALISRSQYIQTQDCEPYHFHTLDRVSDWLFTIYPRLYMLQRWLGIRMQGLELSHKFSARLPGYVYLFRLPTNHYKIGYSANPERRSKELIAASIPIDIEIKHIFSTNQMACAETIMHSLYKDKRIGRTEWFNLDNEDVYEIRAIGDMTFDWLETDVVSEPA